MPTIPLADMTEMLSTSELGDAATIETVSVIGIFDNEYFSDFEMTGTTPAFTCIKSVIDAITPAVIRGTTVTVNAVIYTIENIKNDGNGLLTLILSTP